MSVGETTRSTAIEALARAIAQTRDADTGARVVGPQATREATAAVDAITAHVVETVRDLLSAQRKLGGGQ